MRNQYRDKEFLRLFTNANNYKSKSTKETSAKIASQLKNNKQKKVC